MVADHQGGEHQGGVTLLSRRAERNVRHIELSDPQLTVGTLR